MTSKDVITVHLPHPEATKAVGASLVHTLYAHPVTILLDGELGSGKTTFLQGFAEALGITEQVTSPTFALEQRYTTLRHGEFLHIDLYRLEPKEAEKLVVQTEHHEGIRCIEWANRISEEFREQNEEFFGQNVIQLSFTEKTDGRQLDCTFRDVPLPSQEQIDEWRELARTPKNVIEHCEAVGTFAKEFAEQIAASRHILVRPQALHKAGQLHDIFRFLDFIASAAPKGIEKPTDQDTETWNRIRVLYNGLRHEAACWKYLQNEGFRELGDIVAQHGFQHQPNADSTIEQKILYYADKRVNGSTVVTLDERFKDFLQRYGENAQRDLWEEYAKNLEHELLTGDK